MLFVWHTISDLLIYRAMTEWIDGIYLLCTLFIFFIAITILTIVHEKKKETPCFKLALPHVLVQTDLFSVI